MKLNTDTLYTLLDSTSCPSVKDKKVLKICPANTPANHLIHTLGSPHGRLQLMREFIKECKERQYNEKKAQM